MSEHAQIMTLMQEHLEGMDGAVVVMPSSLAWSVYKDIADQDGEELTRYLCLEQLKAMARKLLAGRFGADADKSEAYQGDFFSGKLQARYPIPVAKGEEAQYKDRLQMTEEERAFNCEMLRKSARARLEHADALEAEPRDGMAA